MEKRVKKERKSEREREGEREGGQKGEREKGKGRGVTRNGGCSECGGHPSAISRNKIPKDQMST
jgi:hypothetical protein